RELVAAAAARAGRTPPVASPLVIQRLLSHDWPGNVRELRHVADYLAAVTDDDRIEPDDLPDDLAAAPAAAVPPERPAPGSATPMRKLSDELEELERQRMTEALARSGGVKTRAAALLGMPIRTFNAKFRQYGL
ncbi:MAG TPA: helix-turn-helix domain-containing protein, partial [Kofleriaceae bacterium]|nr:helix-turn-helix domain-containing protein [Kofleriaceae bacterium]